ncbi:taperin [Gastrophryne carolinensis]
MAVSGGTKAWGRLEPGKMPAWKLEVLERKRQKMAGSGSLSSRGKELSPSRSSRKGSPERLVLQDSLGPLHENPFIKQEKERRRRRPQFQSGTVGRASSPIRHLLDLYGNVPGIRTIRAENIIIIESDPGFFTQSSHTAGATTGDPLEELLAKRGNKVAEIRASEVIIYEPEPKKPQAPLEKEPEDEALLEEAGRVSRLLEKFDHGHSRPVRSRSWENLLEKEHKPPLLPKSPSTERPGQLPLIKAPKHSGEISPSSVAILEEDGKRFPLNNPSWHPSKQPTVHSMPDPGLFHKRPSSPGTPPAALSPVSPLSPLSLHYDEKLVVANVREKFEVGCTNNNHPLSKLGHVTQKIGSNTMVINPKATFLTDRGAIKSPPPLANGHVDHLESNTKTGASIDIQDLLNKSKRPRGSTTQRLSTEVSGVVPSASISDVPKGANERRPKYVEVNQPKISIPTKSSAETTFPNHYEQSFHSATPSMQMRVSSSTSKNDSFEIRPAPKPDLSSIPEDNMQARALANIRMQSKNSFVFVPKKRQAPSEPKQGCVGPVPTNDKPKVQVSASTLNGPKRDFTNTSRENQKSKEDHDVVNGGDQVEGVTSPVAIKASSVPSLSDFDWKSGLLPSKSPTENQSFTDIGAELDYLSSLHQEDAILTVPVTKIHEDVVKADIPVTNIDDIVHSNDQEFGKSAVKTVTDPIIPPSRPHTSLSNIRPKGTNTFTVIPKRKPVTEQEAFRTPLVEEDDEEDTRSKRKSSDGTEPPYSDIGTLLKKRYPTVDEIKVIGGYMSLSKSCLLKNGSTRKKMKISFNEQNIHTMFEYPSENSLAEEEDSGSESEEEEDRSSILLPRPALIGSSATSNGLRAKAPNSGLSNYMPKHSMEYSKWQDEKYQGRSMSPDGSDNTDMLTPADGNSHSDFRSEPALYF